MRKICLLTAFLASLSLHSKADASGLTFFTENYPPFNYRNQTTGEPEGLSVNIIHELMRRTGFAYSIKIAPWKRGYEKTLAQDNTCLFTTGRTQERERLFKWVTPFINNALVLFSTEEKSLEIKSLDDVAQYRIGGYLGDATADYLIAKNIPVETVGDDKLNLRKLQGGRIDLWATGQLTGMRLAQEVGFTKLKRAFLLTNLEGGIACNLHLNDIIITRMQQELDELYRDGFMEKLYHTYLPGIPLPEYQVPDLGKETS